MTKTRAFLIHLAISLALFVVLASIVRWYWYPGFFFDIDGGWQGLRLIIGVDLVMGPLLTLVVYKAGKAGLAFDLSAIAIVQVACLCAGMWIVHNERPEVLAYTDGHFYSLSKGSFEEFELSVPDLAHFPGEAPHWVWINLPKDPIEQSAVRKQAIQNRVPLRFLIERYEPFEMNQTELAQAFSLDAIRKKDAAHGFLEKWIAEHGGELEGYAFFPLGTRYNYLFMGFDRSSARFVGLLKTPGIQKQSPQKTAP